MSLSKSILIVDDDREIVHALRESLTKVGFDVETASDGNVAVAKVLTHQFDAMILDLMMPKRSGLLVLEYLRIETQVDMPIVMITGSAGWRHEKQARLLGVDAYLRKPFPIEDLRSELYRMLDCEPVTIDNSQ